jgi:hypothetical protein
MFSVGECPGMLFPWTEVYIHLLDRSRNNTKVKTNVILSWFWLECVLPDFSTNLADLFINWKHSLFSSREHIEQKKKNRSNISSYDRECIQSYNFCSLSEFSEFLCNCPDFFFPKISKTITNKTKKELRISIVPILSYGLEFIQKSHRKKALSVFPEFSNFSFAKNLIRTITNPWR